TGNVVVGLVVGDAAVPNGTGVSIEGDNSTLGGTTVAARNVISGNTTAGVAIAGSNNVVLGNFIGTDAAGSAAVGNGVGIAITGPRNTVGGTSAAGRNVIAGNRQPEVTLTGPNATDNVLAGNFIGTDATGAVALASRATSVGVQIDGASGNAIGGTAAGA